MIPCQRHLFDIPDEIAYFNCAYLGPQMQSVREAGYEGVDRKSHPWKVVPSHFFDESELVRDLFARLISAGADDIAIIPSVSYGVAIAAASIDLGAGDEIIMLEEQFPSNVYPWLEVAKRTQACAVQVQREESETWTQAVLRRIGPATKVVTLPNVHWTDGRPIDLEQVADKCRQVHALLVLDLTQSLGALPFSVAAVRPAFVICAGYKWLLGPYSLGYLYVAPEFQNCSPVEHNWLNRKESEDFAGLVDYKDDFQPGARRFDVGERSNFALMPMALAALEQIHEWQVPAIHETLSALTGKVAHQALELGLEVSRTEERAGHMLGIRFPNGVPDGMLQNLSQENVYVSVRGNAVRISPHLHNNEADVSRLLDVMRNSL